LEGLENRRLMAAGDIDTTFGTNGRATLDITTPSDDYMTSIIALPSGGFLAGHNSYVSASSDSGAFSRHLASGQLDSSFGSGGLLRLNDNWGTTGIRDMFLRNGGTEVIAMASGPSGTPVVRGFTVDGAPLPAATFSFPVGAATGTLWAMTPLPSGGGLVLSQSGVWKFLPSGALDSTFGSGGSVIFPTVSNQVFRGNGITTAADGSVFIAGYRQTLTTAARQAAVVKLTTSGAFDSTFGSGGTALLPTSASNSQVGSVRLDASNRPVVSGFDSNTSLQWGILARLTTTGGMDGSFNTTGIRQFLAPAGSTATLPDVRIEAGGKLVITGLYANSSSNTYFIGRVTSAGALDTSFAGDGINEALLPGSAGVQVWYGPPLLDASGNVIMGIGTRPVITAFGDSTLLRIRGSDGQRDTTFGTLGGNGTAVCAFAGSTDNRTTACVRQPDGKLVFVGIASAGAARWLVGRMNADGSPDTSFGTGGTMQIDWGASNQIPNDVKIDSSGRIVIAGWVATTNSTDTDVALARLTSSGALDSTFGTGGLARYNVAATDEIGIALGFQSNGKIVVGGWSEATTTDPRRATVFRFNSNGSLDTSFGAAGRGVITTPDDSLLSTVHVLAGDAIIATGSEDDASFNTRRFAAKLTAGGALDAAYGTGGVTPIGTFADDIFSVARSVIDSAGRVYVPGTKEIIVNGFYRDVAFVSRVNAAGLIDSSFGTNGTVQVPLRGTSDNFTALGLDSIGRVFIGADIRVSTSPANDDMVITRLHGSGAVDTSFGNNGERQIDLSPFDRPMGIFPTPDGKLVVMGDAHPVESGTDWAATRLLNPSGDGTPPQVTAGNFAWDQAPPAVALAFSESVGTSVEPGDFVLSNLTSGQTIPTGTLAVSSPAPGQALLSFPGQPQGALPDGNYRLRLRAGSIADLAGTPLVEDFVLDFFALAADANHDRVVDTLDFNALAGNFGQSGRTFSMGDFNYDGIVDTLDFNTLAAQFGKSLAPAAAPSVAPPALTAAPVAPVAPVAPQTLSGSRFSDRTIVASELLDNAKDASNLPNTSL
jgi:uncharacterized delta-60 repeat protein